MLIFLNMATHGNNAHIVDFFYSHITVPNHVFIFRQFDCINGSISHFTLHSLTRSGSFCIEWHIFEAKFSTPRPGRGRGQNSGLEALASLVMGFQPVSFQLPVPFRSRLSARHGTDRQTDRQQPSVRYTLYGAGHETRWSCDHFSAPFRGLYLPNA